MSHEDKPDIIGCQEDKRIGIEVTRFSPRSERGWPKPEEQAGLRQLTMRLAREAYTALGGAPLQVHATFTSDRLTKSRASPLAREIAHYLSHDSKPLVIYKKAVFDRRFEDSFLPEIASLDAIRIPGEEQGAWYAGQRGWPRHADEQDIHRVLENKESRVATYRERCDELWLLIVFEMLGDEIEVRPPSIHADFAVRSGFDRILCLAPARDACVEISVLPRGQPVAPS